MICLCLTLFGFSCQLTVIKLNVNFVHVCDYPCAKDEHSFKTKRSIITIVLQC